MAWVLSEDIRLVGSVIIYKTAKVGSVSDLDSEFAFRVLPLPDTFQGYVENANILESGRIRPSRFIICPGEAPVLGFL